MNPMQVQVTDWYIKFGVPIAAAPTIIPMTRRALRMRLIQEETNELDAAFVRGDIVAIADALADLLYVTFGTAVEFGIDMEPIFNEIQRSNLSKLGADGKPIYDLNQKVMKGSNYSPPKLGPILKEQGLA